MHLERGRNLWIHCGPQSITRSRLSERLGDLKSGAISGSRRAFRPRQKPMGSLRAAIDHGGPSKRTAGRFEFLGISGQIVFCDVFCPVFCADPGNHWFAMQRDEEASALNCQNKRENPEVSNGPPWAKVPET